MAKESPNQIALNDLVERLKRDLLPVLSIPKRYLGEQEASHYLSLSVFTLRAWRSKGSTDGPPYLKLGTKVLYDRESLDSWMEQFRRER